MGDFSDAMLEDHPEVDTLLARLFSPSQPPTLALSDFPQFGLDRRQTEEILGAADLPTGCN